MRSHGFWGRSDRPRQRRSAGDLTAAAEAATAAMAVAAGVAVETRGRADESSEEIQEIQRLLRNAPAAPSVQRVFDAAPQPSSASTGPGGASTGSTTCPTPPEVLYAQGWLLKESYRSRTWRRRWVLLSGSALIIATAPGQYGADSTVNVPLDERVWASTAGEGAPQPFVLEVSTPARRWRFSCRRHDECAFWIREINRRVLASHCGGFIQTAKFSRGGACTPSPPTTRPHPTLETEPEAPEPDALPFLPDPAETGGDDCPWGPRGGFVPIGGKPGVAQAPEAAAEAAMRVLAMRDRAPEWGAES